MVTGIWVAPSMGPDCQRERRSTAECNTVSSDTFHCSHLISVLTHSYVLYLLKRGVSLNAQDRIFNRFNQKSWILKILISFKCLNFILSVYNLQCLMSQCGDIVEHMLCTSFHKGILKFNDGPVVFHRDITHYCLTC